MDWVSRRVFDYGSGCALVRTRDVDAMSDNNQQSRIERYGIDKSRPVLLKDVRVGPIQLESTGQTYPGYRGPVPARDAYGFVQFCDSSSQFDQNEGLYMIPLKVLEHLRSRDVTVLLIAEQHEEYVYEFHESQFDEEAPKRAKGRDEKDEVQMMVDTRHHQGKYAEHTDTVMIGSREGDCCVRIF